MIPKTNLKLQNQVLSRDWKNIRIGITGATGTLGRALIKTFHSKGAFVVGFTHGSENKNNKSVENPDEWVHWECGKERDVESYLMNLDILILNHGINIHSNISNEGVSKSLEVNALSSWRLIEIFESICLKNNCSKNRELWINTSEAEVQPALSPAYEISKRLIGQLASIKLGNKTNKELGNLKIRKLILGPFKSKLNPLGIMSPDFVANQIALQANYKCNLIIVTPNPLTYILIPLNELIRLIYLKLFSSSNLKR